MSLSDLYPLCILVRKPKPNVMIPFFVVGKTSRSKGLAAFKDRASAINAGHGWEPDFEVSELDEDSFIRVAEFFAKNNGVTHVALDATEEDHPNKAAWIPIYELR